MADPYYDLAFIRENPEGQVEFMFYESENRGDSTWILGNFTKSHTSSLKKAQYFSFDFGEKDLPKILRQWNLKKTKKLKTLLQNQQNQKTMEKTKRKSMKAGDFEDWYDHWRDYKFIDYDSKIGEYLAKQAGFVNITKQVLKK